MPIAILSRSRVVTALFVACASCGRDATGVPSVSRGAFQILAGMAVDERGVAVAGAPVRITGVVNGSTTSPVVTIAGCSGFRWFVDSLQTTAGDGRFAKSVGFGPGSVPLCLAVEVMPPTGATLKAGVAWVPNVFPTGSTGVPDTTRITVILQRN